jgi:hypothetical protein
MKSERKMQSFMYKARNLRNKLLLSNLDESKANIAHDEIKDEHANQNEEFVP